MSTPGRRDDRSVAGRPGVRRLEGSGAPARPACRCTTRSNSCASRATRRRLTVAPPGSAPRPPRRARRRMPLARAPGAGRDGTRRGPGFADPGRAILVYPVCIVSMRSGFVARPRAAAGFCFRRCPMSHAAVRDVELAAVVADTSPGFDGPHLVTELPGPKARAHIAFDERYTSPSLPRAYPIVPVRGRGSVIEDIDGNLFSTSAPGSPSTSRALSPEGRRRHPGAGRAAAPLQRLRLLPADLCVPRGRARADRADARSQPVSSWATRNRGGGGGHEAGPLRHGAPVHRSASWAPSTAARSGASASRPPRQVPRPFRADAAGHPPRSLRVGRPGRAGARVFHRLVPANEGRRSSSSRSQGEGGIRSRTPSSCPVCAHLRRPARDPLVADEVQSGWPDRPDVGDPALGRGAGRVSPRRGLASGMPIGA